MSDLAFYRGIASAVAVDDDVLPESIARAGDIEEAIFWLLARASKEGRQLPDEQAQGIVEAFPALSDAVTAVNGRPRSA
jgi:hypothetical protein